MPEPSRQSGGPAVIACQQVLTDDSAVFSIQWVDLPADTDRVPDSDGLLHLYLGYLRRVTLSLVRPTVTTDGLDFRLAGSDLTLLKFTPTARRESGDGSTTSLLIAGGLLVQQGECDRGRLDLQVSRHDSGIRIALELSDYCPLLLGGRSPSPWRRCLYRLSQSLIHRLVTVRFLAMVHNRLTGRQGRIDVVHVELRPGRRI
jgi:hypothetical protein